MCVSCASLNPFPFSVETKNELLVTKVDTFHKAVFWGEAAKVAADVTPKLRGSFAELLTGDLTDGRLIDLKIEKLDYPVDNDEDALKAEAQIIFRVYTAPTYVVKAFRKKELWSFDKRKGNWELTEVVDLGEAKDVGTALGRMR